MSDFSTDERVNVLLKNFIGVPNTKKEREWYQESYKAGESNGLTSGHALSHDNIVLNENLWTSTIPEIFVGSPDLLTTYVPGTYTVTNVNINSDNTVLEIEKLKLQRVESGNDQSWYCLGDNSVNVLKDIIPFNYKETGTTRPYAYTLYNGSSTEMPYGANGGNWMIDHKTGVVYIPDASDISGGIHADGLYLTFYKYVGNKGAIVPGSISLPFKNELKLVASDRDHGDEFGRSVAISGNYAIVGAPYWDAAEWSEGAAYIFDVTTGNELHRLVANDAGADDRIGWSVAISGKYAIAGARNWDGTANNQGAAYIFDVTTGNELHRLVASDAGAEDTFGYSVAISGNYAIVGAPYLDGTANNQGAAYIFDVTTGNELHRLVASDAATNVYFGWSVAISDKYAIAGARDLDGTANNQGAAYIFDVTTGNELHRLVASDAGAEDKFGDSVAISGKYVIVGAPYWGASDTGAAYIFDVTTGQQLHRLVANDSEAYTNFGKSVAISGKYAIVGVPNKDNTLGAAYIFDITTGQQLQKLESAAAAKSFGYSVAISGKYVIVGAKSDIDNTLKGAAYIYNASTDNIVVENNITTNTGYPYYQSLGTEKIVNPPSTTKTVHGVNITAMNKRTRASYASAEACVDTWTSRSQNSNNWRSICWSPELSMFVAVAKQHNQRVLYSYDGINWTGAWSVNGDTHYEDWQCVCWSPELSKFVAVATWVQDNAYRVMTSPDGISWTARTNGVDNSAAWNSVCWSPELSIFVAVAYSGTNRVMTSPDGDNWTLRSAAEDNYWRSVCWSPELSIFVAVSDSGTNRVMTSPNGINWTVSTNGVDNIASWNSVCWSPELSIFAAVAISGYNRVMTSPDGIHWTTTMNGVGIIVGWRSVCWSPDLSIFVAVGYHDTNRVMTSPDGIHWTGRSAAEDNQWQSVCWSPELSIFAAVADSGTNRVMTSAIGMPNSKSVVKALPSQMMVDASGNVGIGTTDPQSLLHMFNDSGHAILKIQTVNNNNKKAGIEFWTDDATPEEGKTFPAAKILSSFTGTNYGSAYLVFQTSESPTVFRDRMIIKGSNVGIGTNEPGSYKLNVEGSIYATSGTITGSDDRLKHNEKPITNALDIIDKLEAKQYFKTTEMYDASHDFELDASGNPLDASGNPLEKGKDYRIENGLIAQDLLKIPELSFVVSGGDKEVEIPIYEKDASGIVLDESGNIAINKSKFTLTSNDEIAIYTDIYEEDLSGNRVYKDSVYKRDASGNYELDASGEKIVDLDNEGGYKLDKEGNVLDESGNKLMDKEGKVLDGSGDIKQVDVKIGIESRSYGVDYMSICVLQMRAIQELKARILALESQ